jgi:LacI family transcriptional regulator
MASNLVRKRSNLLGMVICGSQYSFFGQVALGAQVKARELGYHILLADSEFDPANERDAIHSLLSVRIAGLILQPGGLGTGRRPQPADQ